MAVCPDAPASCQVQTVTTFTTVQKEGEALWVSRCGKAGRGLRDPVTSPHLRSAPSCPSDGGEPRGWLPQPVSAADQVGPAGTLRATAVLTGSGQSPEDALTSLGARATLPGSQRTSPVVGCSHEATPSASGVTDTCVVWLGVSLIDVINWCATL